MTHADTDIAILGAGIYVLAGKVAGESGIYAPQAFVLAAIVVSFSAYSFARLSSRFPSAAVIRRGCVTGFGHSGITAFGDLQSSHVSLGHRGRAGGTRFRVARCG